MSSSMKIKDLLLKNRSYRRFEQTPITAATLIELVELTRLCPSAANRQPLKYLLTDLRKSSGPIRFGALCV